MDISTVNWIAVLVAGVSAFILGGIWYSSKLFGAPWLAETKLTNEQINQSNKARTFGWAFVFSLIMAANLALFLNEPSTTATWGAAAGFLAGIWVFSGLAITALFELKSWKYVFINGGYLVLALILMGLILGAWR